MTNAPKRPTQQEMYEAAKTIPADMWARGWHVVPLVNGKVAFERDAVAADACSLHGEGDASEFGFVLAETLEDAKRIDAETFGEPAAPVETESRYPVDKPGKIDAIRYAFLLSGMGARTTHGNVTLQAIGDEFVLSAPGKAPHRLAIEHTSAARLDSHWQAYVAANAGTGEPIEPAPVTLKTYTAFCVDDSDLDSTTWIEAIQAPDAETAQAIAESECADAWGYAGDDRDSVRCIGLAVGDVEIVHWED